MGDLSAAEEIYRRFGKNVLYLRQKNNISQKTLAEKINISQPLLSQYENGRRRPSLETIECISKALEVSLLEIMFEELGEAEENISTVRSLTSSSDQINCCAAHNYYCYFIKEQSDGNSSVKANIHSFAAEIGVPEGTHKAKVSVVFPKAVYRGTLEMDESYAYLLCNDKKKDFFLLLTFYYYRKSTTHYQGGLGLLQRIDYNNLPVAQYCIISPREIKNLSEAVRNEMLKLLKITFNTGKISTWRFSSDGILRLTKSHDAQVLDWLRSKNLTRK